MYRTPALSIAFRVHLVKARGRSRSIPQTSLSFANAKDIPRSQSHFAPEPAPHSMVSLGSSAFDLGVGVFPPFHSKGEFRDLKTSASFPLWGAWLPRFSSGGSCFRRSSIDWLWRPRLIAWLVQSRCPLKAIKTFKVWGLPKGIHALISGGDALEFLLCLSSFFEQVPLEALRWSRDYQASFTRQGLIVVVVSRKVQLSYEN